MGWLTRIRWAANWGGYVLWWLGCWIALHVMLVFSLGLFLWQWPGLLSQVIMAAAVGLLSALVVIAAWRSAPSHVLRCVDRELGGRLSTCRQDPAHQGDDDPSGMSAFIGMFAGPVLAFLLTALLRSISERLGNPPPLDGTFAYTLLLGAWLGAFTWIHLNARLNSHVAATWLSVSGSVSLAVIAWTVALHSRLADGGWNRKAALAALFNLAVPLAWSVHHLVAGMRAQMRGGNDGGEMEDGDHWRLDGPHSPDGGSGRPAPSPTSPSQRWGSHAEHASSTPDRSVTDPRRVRSTH